jgi:NAD(P)-dependent dehydrogenase (short-subunit alcohol dehydrogenase family)
MRLSGKVALVTGAGRGIGQGLALGFAEAGARVAVHYLKESDEAEAMCHRIVERGGKAAAFQADLADSTQRDRLFAAVVAHFKRLDILINNAGYDPGPLDFLASTEEQYDAVLDVNMKAVYFCSQAAARQMILQESGGKIVNIGSIHAFVTAPGRTAYAASKGGLHALTRALALDLAPQRINVNAIAPGFIEVERSIQSVPGYDRRVMGQLIPWGRVGVPADISSLAVFLASPEADFLTGQVFTADGGTSSRMAL